MPIKPKVHPAKKGNLTGPQDIFLQLLAIIALYWVVIQFGALIFQYINLYFPDPLNDFGSPSSFFGPIRFALAALTIVFPVYLGVSWFLYRNLKRSPEKREMAIRKWLLNFTLFAAALVMMGDMVVLINRFLEGELTVRFLLKIATVFFIAASVFGYYLWDLRRDFSKNEPRFVKAILALLVMVVVGAVAAGFFIAGSPQLERLRKFDERRVNDLQQIQSQIIFFWQQKNHLPASLNDLTDSISGYVSPRDPEDNSPYAYAVRGELEFELCANFKTKSEEKYPYGVSKPMMPGMFDRDYPVPAGGSFDTWSHDAGNACFSRVIDPELYKIKGKQ